MKKCGALLIITIIALMTGSGCYTVLRHSENEEGFSNYDDSYNETYGYSHYYYPSYWTHTPRWGRYYAVPWWWEHGYYHGSETVYYDDDGSPRSSGGQKATPASRFGEIQPPGAPSITRGSSGSGTSGTSSSSSSGTATKQQPAEQKSDADAKSVKTKEKQENTEENTQETKPTRDAGRWHKK
jgi:hypothetical protein